MRCAGASTIPRLISSSLPRSAGMAEESRSTENAVIFRSGSLCVMPVGGVGGVGLPGTTRQPGCLLHSVVDSWAHGVGAPVQDAASTEQPRCRTQSTGAMFAQLTATPLQKAAAPSFQPQDASARHAPFCSDLVQSMTIPTQMK